MEKKQIGWEWDSSKEYILKLTGSQIDYINNLARMFSPLVTMSNILTQQLIENKDVRPVYDNNESKSVEDIIEEAVKKEDANSPDKAVKEPKPEMKVV